MKDRIDVGLMPNSSTPPKGFTGWPKPERHSWRWVMAILVATTLIILSAQIARAEGETVSVLEVTCDAVTVTGSGYTPGQDLLTFARAPQGEGTITDPKVIKADGEGLLPPTDLEFGGDVPDGTYQAVITTPGPGQKEEVVKEFQITGCLAGQRAVSAKADCTNVIVTGTGFEQTNATVEALVLGEGEMKAQVQPDAQGRFTATIPWANPPLSGEHTVEVRIDNIKRAEANFPVGDCSGAALPFTGASPRIVLLGVILLLIGTVLLLLFRRRT